MGYRDLEIWQLADDLAIDIHFMTLRDLPKFEMYETGSQVRRSSKSIKSNITEGYARKHYKKEFLHFLRIALGSADETRDHLDTLFKTGSLVNQEKYASMVRKSDLLVKKLCRFIHAVEKNHRNDPEH
jgi:four helix bundle protein